MKEKLYRLITEEVYEVTCHNYVEDDDDDYYYHPRGTVTYYFTNKEKAEEFYHAHRADDIKSFGWKYISKASSPYKITREEYVEVTEDEVRALLVETEPEDKSNWDVSELNMKLYDRQKGDIDMHYNFKLYTVVVTRTPYYDCGNYLRCSGRILGTFGSKDKALNRIEAYKKDIPEKAQHTLKFEIHEVEINKPDDIYVTSYVE